MNEAAKIIIDDAKKQKITPFIVGGAVRDLISGAPVKDIDFLVEGNAIQFAKQAGYKIKSEHQDFGTVKVEIGETSVDIASTRTEKYPSPGCLPVIEKIGVCIEEDLKRRDFTVNSIAINLLTNEYIDPFDGRNDIQKGVLRVLHEKSFTDDPTRILRGLDFKYRFNFDFGEKEKTLIKKCCENYDSTGASIDRIYFTLNKVFKKPSADKILKDISENKIYKIWTKEIGIKTEDIPALIEAMEKFNIRNREEIFLLSLNCCPYIKASFKNDFEIYNFFKKFSDVQLCFYYFKTKDESALKYLKIRDVRPFITGKILLQNGFVQGEGLGRILDKVLKEKIMHPERLATLDDELDFARKLAE